MKKLFLLSILSLSLFILNIGSISANWYGSFNQLPGGIETWCDTDGDYTGGSPSFSRAPMPGSYSYDSQVVSGGAGGISCERWDAYDPVEPTVLGFNFAKKGNIFGADCNASGGVYYCNSDTVAVGYNWGGAIDQGGSDIKGYIIEVRGKGAGVVIQSYWVTGNTANLVISGLADGEYETFIQTHDYATNSSNNFRQGPDLFIDTVPPTLTDIDLTSVPPDNLLANTNYPYSIDISVNGGSPIDSVSYRHENDDDESLLGPTIDTTHPLSFDWDVSKVDNFRDKDGSTAREYTLEFGTICDMAGNCSTGTQDFNHNVYADSSILSTGGTKSAGVTNVSDGSAIADGSVVPLSISLVDQYGNEIIPATGINRRVNFKFDTSNTLHLNQYNPASSSSAAFVDLPIGGGTTEYMFPLIANSVVTFSDQLSDGDDGIYVYDFRLYSPTENGNLLLAGTGQDFQINSIHTSITDTISGGVLDVNIVNSSNIPFNFKPLYTTAFVDGIKENGFIEGVNQETLLHEYLISGGRLITPGSGKKYIEFGQVNASGDNIAHPDFNLQINSQLSVEGMQPSYFSFTFLENISFSINGVETLLSQDSVTISTIEDSYLGSIIEYEIDGKKIVYPWDIIGKDTYFGSVQGLNTNQVGVKILGNTFSNDHQDILSGQSGSSNDIKIVKGDISKAVVKKNVNESLSEKIRNLPKNDRVPYNLVNSNILYIYLAGGSVNYSDAIIKINIQAGKTLLIEGGDLIIDEDIDLAESIGIVVVTNANGDGGNILMDDDVLKVKALMYIEKSLLPYSDGDGGGYVGILNISNGVGYFKNQLYIEGSVLSNNTIGGSRKTPVVCPYYVDDALCDKTEAQKYDLNFLRRYYLIEDGLNPGFRKPANGGLTSPDLLSGSDVKYPLVIKYNSSVQVTPLPLFGRN